MSSLRAEVLKRRAARENGIKYVDRPVVSGDSLLNGMANFHDIQDYNDVCVAIAIITPNGTCTTDDQSCAISVVGVGSEKYLMGYDDGDLKHDGYIHRLMQTGWNGQPWPLEVKVVKLNGWHNVPFKQFDAKTHHFQNDDVQKLFDAQMENDRVRESLVGAVGDSFGRK